MSTSAERRPDTADDQAPARGPRVLVVGVGGVGSPAALALASSGVGALGLADDDRVELENLHRQILFSEADIGRPKIEAARDALVARSPGLAVALHPTRALPATAMELVRTYDVIVDATDNFASRFLLADACRLGGVAVVHAAAVRWTGTVLCAAAAGAPCYRCLFEDLPQGPAPDCATAGILGPVCGVVGAIAAEMALRLAGGDRAAAGSITTFDGRTDELRVVEVAARRDCPLCGERPSIHDLDETRYVGPACAA